MILSLLQNSRDAFLQTLHDDMKIDIHANRKDGYAILSIKDNAGGIPIEIIENIFDVYMTTKSDGSGLGLHISKSIIEEMMRGKISVQNIENGTEFIISVPEESS